MPVRNERSTANIHSLNWVGSPPKGFGALPRRLLGWHRSSHRTEVLPCCSLLVQRRPTLIPINKAAIAEKARKTSTKTILCYQCNGLLQLGQKPKNQSKQAQAKHKRRATYSEKSVLKGGAVANRLRRRTSDQTVLGSNPAVAAALSPWTRLFTPIVPRRSLHISFYQLPGHPCKIYTGKKKKKRRACVE